jgi:hypothetical protein
MRNSRYVWLVGLIATVLIIVVPVVVFASRNGGTTDDPWMQVQAAPAHTDHTDLIQGPFTTGPEVTAACLECHPEAGQEMMQSVHWTWQAPAADVAWQDEPVSTGKANLLNNFCIGAVELDWLHEMPCGLRLGKWHVFETADQTSVDCLVCHDQSGTYAKANSGRPPRALTSSRRRRA